MITGLLLIVLVLVDRTHPHSLSLSDSDTVETLASVAILSEDMWPPSSSHTQSAYA